MTNLHERIQTLIKSSSDVGTGGPATMAIEADVPPTSPGHGDACGTLRYGSYRLTRLYDTGDRRSGAPAFLSRMHQLNAVWPLAHVLKIMRTVPAPLSSLPL